MAETFEELSEHPDILQYLDTLQRDVSKLLKKYNPKAKKPKVVVVPMTNAEFAEKLNKLSTEHKNLMKINSKFVCKNGKNVKSVQVDGVEITRKGLRSMSSEHTKNLKMLKNAYRDLGRSKSKRSGSTGAGFKAPMEITEEFASFIQNADFGELDAKTRDALDQTIGRKITTRAILTPLMNAYFYANNLRKDVDGKKVYFVSDEMNAALDESLTRLEEEDRELRAREGVQYDKNGKVKPAFDRSNFVNNRLQSIIKANTIQTAKKL